MLGSHIVLPHARLTLRSPPTRTRRALFGRHAAAERWPPENRIEPRRVCAHARCELDHFILLE